MDYSFLDKNKIIPVVVIKKYEDTLPMLEGLLKGGINCAEITFRTECAKDSIKLACEKMPNMTIGAGTVITSEQAISAINAGAKFIVSPGFSQSVYEVAKQNDIPYLPGVITPTEIISARELGLKVLKFFPASVFGGTKALKALGSVFTDIQFVPTGGIDENNILEYIKLPCVKSVGGSFMFKQGIDSISEISAKAVEIVNKENK